MQNLDPISEAWKLSKNEEKNFGKIFDYSILLKRPYHSSGFKLFHKHAMKGCWFEDCNNKATHTSWTTKEKSQFDKLVREVRKELSVLFFEGVIIENLNRLDDIEEDSYSTPGLTKRCCDISSSSSIPKLNMESESDVN